MDQDRKETVKALRTRLSTGETLEVAGYQISAALASGVCAVSLPKLVVPAVGPVEWIEVTRESKPPPEPTARTLESARSAGASVRYHQVVGEPFWTSTEIVVVPSLIAKTAELLNEAA
jgi:hypothetical protein